MPKYRALDVEVRLKIAPLSSTTHETLQRGASSRDGASVVADIFRDGDQLSELPVDGQSLRFLETNTTTPFYLIEVGEPINCNHFSILEQKVLSAGPTSRQDLPNARQAKRRSERLSGGTDEEKFLEIDSNSASRATSSSRTSYCVPSRSIALSLKAGSKAFIERKPRHSVRDMKYDCFYNGKHVCSNYFSNHYKYSRNDVVIVSGCRTSSDTEQAWIIRAPNDGQTTDTQPGDAQTARHAVQSRWGTIQAAISGEAEVVGYDAAGKRLPLGDYLDHLSKVAVPPHLLKRATGSLPSFGTIDVVLSLGKGCKAGNTNLLGPERLLNPARKQHPVRNDSCESMVPTLTPTDPIISCVSSPDADCKPAGCLSDPSCQPCEQPPGTNCDSNASLQSDSPQTEALEGLQTLSAARDGVSKGPENNLTAQYSNVASYSSTRNGPASAPLPAPGFFLRMPPRRRSSANRYLLTPGSQPNRSTLRPVTNPMTVTETTLSNLQTLHDILSSRRSDRYTELDIPGLRYSYPMTRRATYALEVRRMFVERKKRSKHLARAPFDDNANTQGIPVKLVENGQWPDAAPNLSSAHGSKITADDMPEKLTETSKGIGNPQAMRLCRMASIGSNDCHNFKAEPRSYKLRSVNTKIPVKSRSNAQADALQERLEKQVTVTNQTPPTAKHLKRGYDSLEDLSKEASTTVGKKIIPQKNIDHPSTFQTTSSILKDQHRKDASITAACQIDARPTVNTNIKPSPTIKTKLPTPKPASKRRRQATQNADPDDFIMPALSRGSVLTYAVSEEASVADLDGRSPEAYGRRNILPLKAAGATFVESEVLLGVRFLVLEGSGF